MSELRIRDDEVRNFLLSAENKAKLRIPMVANECAKMMENYAKSNRPWRDRTSMARLSLTGFYEMQNGKVYIGVAHGVEYGADLEYGYEERYSILRPTVNALKDKVIQLFSDLKRLVG